MFKVEYDKQSKTNVYLVLKDNLLEGLNPLKENNLFSGKCGEVYSNLDFNNEGSIYVGLGCGKDLEKLRLSGFKLGQKLNQRKIKDVSIIFKGLENRENILEGILEGLIHSQYKFDYYKNKKEENTLEVVKLNDVVLYKSKVKEVFDFMEGVFIARDLVNLTPFDLYPETYANKVLEIFKDTNVEVEVYDKKQIEELGMKAFLAVNQGSSRDPRFVVLKYFNDKSTDKHITFVGKGLTYDSGGYAIKPAGSMASMNSDMAGSASVVGALKAISNNNLEINVVGVMALTENMISGSAYKNGDIISSMKGTTIEVINTDAEGRITLADSIYYAATKLNSTEIIELSTLTGAVISALGNNITGVVTEFDDLYERVHNAGLEAGEFNWRLPITEQLKKNVKGDVGELKNSVKGGAGAITAGIFLTHFAEDKPFIHLDIAGPSYGSAINYLPNGASGIGVKTLFKLVK